MKCFEDVSRTLSTASAMNHSLFLPSVSIRLQHRMLQGGIRAQSATCFQAKEEAEERASAAENKVAELSETVESAQSHIEKLEQILQDVATDDHAQDLANEANARAEVSLPILSSLHFSTTMARDSGYFMTTRVFTGCRTAAGRRVLHEAAARVRTSGGATAACGK